MCSQTLISTVKMFVSNLLATNNLQITVDLEIAHLTCRLWKSFQGYAVEVSSFLNVLLDMSQYEEHQCEKGYTCSLKMGWLYLNLSSFNM